MGPTARTWSPIPHAAVTIDDPFWSPRLTLNRERTLPSVYEECDRTGHFVSLRRAQRPGAEPDPVFGHESDVAKWLEAACYSLATHPDAELERRVDEAIALLAAAQQPDGYLNPYITVCTPDARWKDLRDAHELYCAGHLMEAGVAHLEATGKRTLLDVVCRLADHIDSAFGPEPGQKRGYCGHPEIELALVKLAHATGEQRYLRLAQYFVDERGGTPNLLAAEPGPHFLESWYARQNKPWTPEFSQAHRPVREQSEVVGHGVRAMYLYCGMADLAASTGDSALAEACRRLWANLCQARLYITGGVGSSAQNEGFTADYDLPNETAYCETCAAIGLVFWAHRLTHLDGDGRYGDVLERALYNGVLSGVAAGGERFFYVNVLASRGNRHRQPWFGTACCPPNLARLLASLGGYIYGQSATEAVVHHYIGGTGRLTLDGQAVVLHQETRYPWEGRITLRVEVAQPHPFTLRLRLPGWCREATLQVNGTPLDLAGRVERGYIAIQREWHDGDTVQLDILMPVERVYAHPAVVADAGRVALQRGPLVYCLEECDHAVAVDRIALPADVPLTSHFEPAVVGGVEVVTGMAQRTADPPAGQPLYSTEQAALTPCALTALPYFAWDNRAAGGMCVWVREAPAG